MSNPTTITPIEDLSPDPKPVIGLGVTMGAGSDCYPYTIVEVSPSGKTFQMTQDDHAPAPGHDYYANQVYTYTPRPQGARVTVRRSPKGYWVANGRRVHVGTRRYYNDPHF